MIVDGGVTRFLEQLGSSFCASIDWINKTQQQHVRRFLHHTSSHKQWPQNPTSFNRNLRKRNAKQQHNVVNYSQMYLSRRV